MTWQRKILCVCAALGLVGLSACGEDAEPPEGDDFTVTVSLDECGFADPAATQIAVYEQSDVFHANDIARIEARARRSPPIGFHEVVATEGSCRLLMASTKVCDPACGSGQVCDATGTCVESPEGIDAGQLTIKGLHESVRLEPAGFDPGGYFDAGELSSDLFGDGDEIGAHFASGDLARALVGVVGVASMDRDLTSSGLDLVDGQDTTVTWTSADEGACVQLVLNGFNVTHGAPLNAIIECESTDTGSLTIPASLIEQFPYGTTPMITEGFDWPHSKLTRYTRSRDQTAAGVVELVVQSTTTFGLSHPEP